MHLTMKKKTLFRSHLVFEVPLHSEVELSTDRCRKQSVASDNNGNFNMAATRNFFKIKVETFFYQFLIIQ